LPGKSAGEKLTEKKFPRFHKLGGVRGGGIERRGVNVRKTTQTGEMGKGAPSTLKNDPNRGHGALSRGRGGGQKT